MQLKFLSLNSTYKFLALFTPLPKLFLYNKLTLNLLRHFISGLSQVLKTKLNL